MSTQDERENALICTEVLGWQRGESLYGDVWYVPALRKTFNGTPDFRYWNQVGQILDALKTRQVYSTVDSHNHDGQWKCVLTGKRNEPYVVGHDDTGPLAIRAAALKYLAELDRQRQRASQPTVEQP